MQPAGRPEPPPGGGAPPQRLDFRTLVHQADPRFCYGLLAVGDAGTAAVRPRRLLVGVHGSERNYVDYLHGFAGLAEAHGLVVLSPLFPANVLGDGNADGYKLLQEGDIRYDLMLLAMVEEVAALTGCDTRRFLLHGYSGGAQFVHRFALLHPQRVRAVSVAAPGQVTLADEQTVWWGGLADVPGRLGRTIDWQQIARIDWHLAVGQRDVHMRMLKEQPPSRWWKDDSQRLKANRIDRLRMLWRSLQDKSVPATLDVMRGLGHGAGRGPAMALARAYFGRHLGDPDW